MEHDQNWHAAVERLPTPGLHDTNCIEIIRTSSLKGFLKGLLLPIRTLDEPKISHKHKACFYWATGNYLVVVMLFLENSQEYQRMQCFYWSAFYRKCTQPLVHNDALWYLSLKLSSKKKGQFFPGKALWY